MIKEEELNENNNINFNNLSPWNSKEFPVKINNIRYNQDYSLFTLATSKGYKIFSTKYLTQVHEETNKVRDFGDLSIVMTYFRSNIVFFTFTKNNEIYTTKELIIFDDFSQNKISSFKSKNENISDFYVGKNEIYIVLETKIIIIELLTFKIIYIIENIFSNYKLYSFNLYGYLAFTKKEEKYKVYIKILNNEENKIVSIKNQFIKPSFEYIQGIQLSPSGKFIAISSTFGNKIHIYYIDSLNLKECFYLGNEINDIIKMSFPLKEDNLLIQINNQKFRVFGFSDILEEQFKCICFKHKNEELVKEVIKKKENEIGWMNYIKNTYFNNSSNKDNLVSSALISIEVKEGILFLDFFGNKNIDCDTVNNTREIIIINNKGFFYKFSYINDENNYDNNNINLELKESIQWI